MSNRTYKKKGSSSPVSRKAGWKNTLIYEAMIAPSTILFLLFTVYPFFVTIGYSFTNYSNSHLFDFRFIGIRNYIDVFTSTETLGALRNSFLYAILMTGFQLLLAVPLAVVLSNEKIKCKGFLRAAFYFPAVVSPLVVGYIWKFLFSTSYFGPINNALTALGLPIINFFGDVNIALYSVIFTQVWQWLGYAMIIVSANITNIPATYYEVAKIDGANGWQKFRHVTLPLLYPSISFVLINSLTGGMQVYDIFVSTTNFGPVDATNTVMGYILNTAIAGGAMGRGSAFSVVFFILLVGFTKILMTLLNKWEEKVVQ